MLENRYKLLVLYIIYIISPNINISQSFDIEDFTFLIQNNDDITYHDFELENNTGKIIYFLNARVPSNFNYKFSSDKIEPNQKFILRLNFQPFEKGKNEYKILVYFSHLNEPYHINISTNVKKIPYNPATACPEISNENKYKVTNIKIIVKDELSNKNIINAYVEYSDRQYIYKDYTNVFGIIKNSIRIGKYYFHASAKNYLDNNSIHIIDPSFNEIIIFLKKNPIIENNSFDNNDINESNEDKITISTNTEANVNPINVINIEESQEELITDNNNNNQIIDTNIRLEKIIELKKVPNNIVFLMDVSASMNKEDRLLLLKKAMLNLSEMLDSVDKITLLSFSSYTNDILKTTSGDQKEKISKAISKMNAAGTTAGSEALKKAFKIANNNFIENANNMVIIATDGDFNNGNDNIIEKLTYKYSDKNIVLSVLGIKCNELHKQNLIKYSKQGNGNFIDIYDEQSADKALIDEINIHSYK